MIQLTLDGGHVAIAEVPPARGGWYDRNRHLYPPDWEAIADAVKDAASRRCEACDHAHDPKAGRTLTVDHVVDHAPANVDADNLAALCQRCHLRRQGMRPAPLTRADALRRLRRRHELERTQRSLWCACDGARRCALHCCQRCWDLQLVWPTTVEPDRLGFVRCPDCQEAI